MNVLYTCDDNYVQHLGASIFSLLFHNSWCDDIFIYIIDNEISNINKEHIESIVSKFKNASIKWLDFRINKEDLKLNPEWSISYTSYARLFIGSLIPSTCERVLYLDSDIIVTDSLKDLWNTNLSEKVVGAVQDTVGESSKRLIGLDDNTPYFNAGVLLIDLVKWSKLDIEKKCFDFIIEKNGVVRHHDQGVLNGVLKSKWKRLPLRYNVMTIHFLFEKNWILHFYKESTEFYSEEEISYAKSYPAILHFTPSFTSRPWEKGCVHPFVSKYWNSIDQTPWRGATIGECSSPWYVRLINWKYRTFKW